MRRRIRPVCAGVARALPRPAKRPGRACVRAAPVRKVVPRPAGGAARDPERDARRLLRPHAHTDEGAAGRSLGEDDLLLALPGQIAAERGRRTALVFDEFQEIVTIDRRYPKLMRAVFQEQPEIAHVYLGSKRHVLERSFDDVNEPFWRSQSVSRSGRSRSRSSRASCTTRRTPSASSCSPSRRSRRDPCMPPTTRNGATCPQARPPAGDRCPGDEGDRGPRRGPRLLDRGAVLRRLAPRRAVGDGSSGTSVAGADSHQSSPGSA
jgi:hypothetical protein